MPTSLTNVNKNLVHEKLTSRTSSPFIVSFKYPMKKGYKLINLDKRNIKEFQSFLDKVCCMTFQQVDESYRRASDKQDKFGDKQIIHYEFTKGGRIHGVIENSRFKVLKIDANHKVHNK